MSERFGHDFARVRVHTGADADESAHDVQALAYTAGSHIVFGPGRFSPETIEGRRLIAHELAHVVQHSVNSDQVRISRSSIPTPLDMTTEAAVARVFDMLAGQSGVQVASEVNIAVLDAAGNWVLGRIDRIVKLADGSIKGVELKLDATSSRTAAQEVYIPLANEGSVVEITGHAADQLGLPRNTQIKLRIMIVSSENVAEAMERLGIKPESLPRIIRRAAGTRPPPSGPSGFGTAPESAEQVPRSPRAVRTSSGAPPAAPAEPGAEMPVVRPRRLAFEAPAAAESSAAVKAGTTVAGIATPIVGVADELLVGDDMQKIRYILGKGLAPDTKEQAFMDSWGLVWQEESFSYSFKSFSWWVYWAAKVFLLNPFVLQGQHDPNQPLPGEVA